MQKMSDNQRPDVRIGGGLVKVSKSARGYVAAGTICRLGIDDPTKTKK